MSLSRSSSILTIAGVTIFGGLIAYAVYFDYKRRNDVEFRKKLRKDKKKVDKTVAQSKEAASASPFTPEVVQEALENLRNEEGPKTAEEREQYFMSQVGMGEQLALQGPEFYLASALSFYRALRVYPTPVELITIYQKTVPEPVFKLIMEMTNLDVTQRVEGYYGYFPPKSMNVSVQDRSTPTADGKIAVRKVLVVNKDFAAGEVIYKENPVVSALDFDLLGKGTHCTHCLRIIQKGMAIHVSDPLSSVYCSKDCQIKAQYQYHNLLFTLESPLPPEIPTPEMTPEIKAERLKAQQAFVEYIKQAGKAAPLLVAKFIARQVAAETSKMMPRGINPPPIDCPEADGGDYNLYDHLERLRYLELIVPEGEIKLFRDVLSTALPGLEQFTTDDRHATMLGKMAYNSYGVCFGGGRDDKPPSKERPEDVEKTRTPYGTSRQIGCGLYSVSAYLTHSCAPSARPSFSAGTSELHLVAARALTKGDELTVAYVDVTQHPDESAADCRRRRRMELARGWRFPCMCSRCVSEMGSTAEGEQQKDESRVEAVVSRLNEASQASA